MHTGLLQVLSGSSPQDCSRYVCSFLSESEQSKRGYACLRGPIFIGFFKSFYRVYFPREFLKSSAATPKILGGFLCEYSLLISPSDPWKHVFSFSLAVTYLCGKVMLLRAKALI